ncbi:MAG: threonylcarbamoyl-AMP synthase [Candidatus Aminicenantes bacterium]|nr:threonylcarbamoyl-AMP synthase [Candidatus Aminicenantes bacterium]
MTSVILWLSKIKELSLSLIFNLSPAGLVQEEYDLIVDKLLQGCLIIYPTETFYGLGGVASSVTVAQKIFELKGRESGKPLPFVASDLDMVLRLVEEPSPLFFRLVEHFWPGSLTVVLRAKDKALPETILGPNGTIAVRIPPLDWLRQIIKKIDCLLISTSANFSGQPPLSSFQEVLEIFKGKVDVIINGGETPGEKPSTIIDLTSPEPVCLREGKIPLSEIWKVLVDE